MPSSRYSAIFLAMLTTKFQRPLRGNEPTCMIEDKTVLSRLGLSTLMTDKFKPQDLSFHQIQLLKSFIEVVMKKPSDERIDFVINHAECTAEREIYSTWFRDRVAPRVNALVESAMRECGFHPQSVLATQESDDFPPANILVNACLTPVAVEMFGDVVMSGDILIDKAIAANLKTLLVHNVSRMGKAYIRAGSVVDKKVGLMNDALKGKSWRMSSAATLLTYHPSHRRSGAQRSFASSDSCRAASKQERRTTRRLVSQRTVRGGGKYREAQGGGSSRHEAASKRLRHARPLAETQGQRKR